MAQALVGAPAAWQPEAIVARAEDAAREIARAEGEARTQLYNLLEALRKIEQMTQRSGAAAAYQPGWLVFLGPKIANVGAKTRNSALKEVCGELQRAAVAATTKEGFRNILEFVKALVAYHSFETALRQGNRSEEGDK